MYPISRLDNDNVGDGFIRAGATGNKDIINYFVSLFDENNSKLNIYRWVINGLLEENKEDLAEEYFQIIKDDINTYTLQHLMEDAADIYNDKSNIKFFKVLMETYLKNRQRFPTLNLEHILRSAIKASNYPVVEYLMKLGMEIIHIEINFKNADRRIKHKRDWIERLNKLHM